MNRPIISRRKSSHKAKEGRHNVSYYTELEASMAGIGSIESIGELGGEISSGVTGCRMSFGNGGTHGSPYVSQRAIQTS